MRTVPAFVALLVAGGAIVVGGAGAVPVGADAAPQTLAVVAQQPPPPSPPPPDTTPPRPILRYTSPQRALLQKKIVIRARCDEPCTLKAEGTITIRGGSTLIPLRSASASRVTTAGRRLSLTLTKAAQRRLARLFAQGRRAQAIVGIRARDAAGNARTGTRTIAILR